MTVYIVVMKNKQIAEVYGTRISADRKVEKIEALGWTGVYITEHEVKE